LGFFYSICCHSLISAAVLTVRVLKSPNITSCLLLSSRQNISDQTSAHYQAIDVVASGADRHNPSNIATCIQFDVFTGRFPGFLKAPDSLR